MPGGGAVHEATLGEGRLYVVETATTSPERPILSATVEVADLDRAPAALGPRACDAVAVGTDRLGRFAGLPPSATHGLWLESLQLR